MEDKAFKESSIRQTLRDAVKQLENSTYLAPVIEGHPVVVDFDMPRAMEDQMRAEGTYCKTDGKYVYVLTELAYDEYLKHNLHPGSSFSREARDEMSSALAREYSHVVMQHTRQQRYYDDSEELKKNTFAVACEIEATRARGVFKDSHVYTEGLTEDTFPCAKGKKRLHQIYQALLEEYGDSIENTMSGADDQPDDGDEQDQEDSQNPSQNDQEQPSNDQDGNEPTSGEDEPQNGSGEPTQQKQGQLTDEQKEKLKAFANKQRATDPSEGDNDMLQGDGDMGGLEPGKDGEEPTLEAVNQAIWERWKAKQVRKTVRRLKGTIQGKVSRKKRSTYSRPSRRMIDDNGLLTRGVAKDREAMPKILVALDCSGSMDVRAVKDIANAIGNIFEDLGRPTKGCKMCLFNHSLVSQMPMRKWKTCIEKYQAWGGTDFDNVAALANELDVDIVIEVGDGFCHFGDKKIADKFYEAGRKWYDATIIPPGDLDYLTRCVEDDEHQGYHREVLYLNEKTAVEAEKKKLSLDSEESLRVHSSKNFRNWKARQ